MLQAHSLIVLSPLTDLHLGDAHLVSISSSAYLASTSSRSDIYVALVVAQSRSRDGRLSGIHLNHLTDALKKLALACKKLAGVICFYRSIYMGMWVYIVLINCGIQQAYIYLASATTRQASTGTEPNASSENTSAARAFLLSCKTSLLNIEFL